MSENFFSRPKDRTLEAYKDWIQQMYQILKPGAAARMSEEQWVEKWKAFWIKADQAGKNQKASAPGN